MQRVYPVIQPIKDLRCLEEGPHARGVTESATSSHRLSRNTQAQELVRAGAQRRDRLSGDGNGAVGVSDSADFGSYAGARAPLLEI